MPPTVYSSPTPFAPRKPRRSSYVPHVFAILAVVLGIALAVLCVAFSITGLGVVGGMAAGGGGAFLWCLYHERQDGSCE